MFKSLKLRDIIVRTSKFVRKVPHFIGEVQSYGFDGTNNSPRNLTAYAFSDVF
jgi:hypothetical protein